MATSSFTSGNASEPSFTEVLGENAPYIAAMYLLNLVLVVAFIDHSALLEGRLAYNAIVGEAAGGEAFTQGMAAGFAGLFLLITLVGVLFALSLANEKRRADMDEFDLEERVSTISIVPSLQLFAIVLTPVLTQNTIVDGMQYLATGIQWLL